MLLSCILVVTSAQVHAFELPNSEMIRRAMRDELKRSMSELRLESLQNPYYMEYMLTIRHSYSAKATVGTLLSKNSTTTPRLSVGIRVGKPQFDNTNFFDVGLSFFGSSDDEESFRNRRIPMEEDYRSLRRELWLASDACYKQSVELFAKKESAVRNRARLDTTHDFVLLPPSIEIDTTPLPDVNRKRYEELIMVVSAVFGETPEIQASSVSIEYLPQTVIYVNSEGREYVKTERQCGLEMVASTQAADGMPLAQIYSVYAGHPDELPNRDSLIRAARLMVDRLKALKNAPTIEPYSGPVLFESQAAAEVFAQCYAPNLCAQRQQLTDRGMQENERSMAFQNKVGARVAADFLSVRSLPSLTTMANTPVFGHYSIDDDGFRPENLTLVESGTLKTLLSSRVPTRRIKVNNARQRGGAPMFDVLELSSDKKHQLDRAAMLKKMMKLLKDRDLPYGYVVRKAMNQNLLFTTLYALTQGDYPISMGETTVGLVEVSRVYPDGHEELVRGTQAAGMAPSQFKDVLATGTKSTVYNYLAPAVTSPYVTGGPQYLPATVIVPDLLFEDVEIRPLDGDFPKPPILASPLSNK